MSAFAGMTGRRTPLRAPDERIVGCVPRMHHLRARPEIRPYKAPDEAAAESRPYKFLERGEEGIIRK